MPDIAAARPVSGQPIETPWGQDVHDAVECIQAGSVSVANITSAAQGSTPVVFPRPYATTPLIFTTVASQNVTPGWQTQTPTGFNAIARRNDGSASVTTQTVQWIAIGTLA